VTVSEHLLRAGIGYGAAHAGAPDGQASDFPPGDVVTITRRVTLAPGRTVLPGPAGAPRTVLYASVTDDALSSFAPPEPGGPLVPGLTGPLCTAAGA
jgi:hypothetical protein